MDCLIVCVPGLEAIVAEEARSLGLRLGRRERGALHATGTTRQIYAANLWLRAATRVLVPLASFRATTFGALERGASAIDWDAVIPPGEVPAFRVTSHGSTLFHTGAVAERLARPFGGTGTETPGDGHPLIVVRIANERVEVRADLSGAALHKRGWRRAVGKAPLRESLAAALVLTSGWDRRSPLIDPFCGSGTIPIEAALLAADVAPGLGRSFAVQRWPSFAPGTWASVVGDARSRAERGLARARSSGVPLLVATDRDDGAIAATRTNAERAGVGDLVDTRRATVSDLVVPPSVERGWIVTNPPWGGRLGDGRSGSRDLRDLYARLGQVVRSLGSGWRVGMLVADERLARHSGLELISRLSLDASGIRVSFLVSA